MTIVSVSCGILAFFMMNMETDSGRAGMPVSQPSSQYVIRKTMFVARFYN